MATLAALHHVEACVHDGYKLATTLVDKYRFNLIAARGCASGGKLADANQWLLHKGYAVFLVTQTPPTAQTEQVHLRAETFSNIAIQVKDIDACLERLVRLGSRVTIPKTKFVTADRPSNIEYAKVTTLLGNLTYTLISDSSRSALNERNGACDAGRDATEWIKSTWCYPGFEWLHCTNNLPSAITGPKSSSRSTHIDHITLVCGRGETDDVIRWHQEAFGMRRFLMNTQDAVKDGFTVQDASSRRIGGLKLKAMEYFHCAESGIHSDMLTNDENTEHRGLPLRIVVAESLPGQGLNQIDAFLEDHGGPGIQHIGLHTDGIVDECRMLTACGVEFQMPPAAYYSQPDKVEEIRHAKMMPNLMQQYGILIDNEADAMTSTATPEDATATAAESLQEQESRYLMQVFTKPLFDNARTFFLEILQRHGATGFGTGNIKALWRSVQITLEQQERENASIISQNA